MRASVAERLAVAQKYLKQKGYGLKIWDAYRPHATQEKLFQAMHNRSFVADPKEGVGSMHIRGAAAMPRWSMRPAAKCRFRRTSIALLQPRSWSTAAAIKRCART